MLLIASLYTGGTLGFDETISPYFNETRDLDSNVEKNTREKVSKILMCERI